MSKVALLAGAFVCAAGMAFADPKLVIDVAGEANGQVVINLRPDLAPNHVERVVTLAKEGAYDGVAFHRVIDGFMAQTGDVEFGKGSDLSRAGMGGSSLPDLKAEFTPTPYVRGVVGMARSQNPDSANSQFFITFASAPFLDGQYTVFGEVESGMEVVDKIRRGAGQSGSVTNPDKMVKVTIQE
ncbi:peptidylprolyl isomerase [Falsigemmobacter intermedius]|uniref:Peptidyl-prolyl cis-trans isomerase n=2 Tax=Falsigemmobacter intermedius TaxID=1553448 RepID=A0A444M9A3_9RHOB|nr:peptidylprolyl isomerase [Falsigemmobacter intermedius]